MRFSKCASKYYSGSIRLRKGDIRVFGVKMTPEDWLKTA